MCLDRGVKPPFAPANVPPLFVIVAVPAFDVAKNSVVPGSVSAPPAIEPLLVIVALPAVEALAVPNGIPNCVKPACAPVGCAAIVGDIGVTGSRTIIDEFLVVPPPARLAIPPLLMIVALPAVDVLMNSVMPFP